MKKSHGAQVKRSRVFRAGAKPTISTLLKNFPCGARVRIKANPSERKGRLSALRFNNRVVEVVGKRGNAFEVVLRDGGKKKTLFLYAAHLQSV